MLNQNVVLYGHETLPPEPLPLRAGELTMLFEPDTAFVRFIRRGDEEIVRCVYAVVRDANWNTIPWQVKNLRTDARADSFEITFDVECSDGNIQYFWRGAISGTAEGLVSYSFDGEAKSDFMRNRIGICVLHPVPQFAGKPCVLEHTNGASEPCEFPKLIAPWQPLRDVRAITTQVVQGVSATVRLEGEVFETEDQRNFGDSSFKTYSTPQDLPKPVQVRAGDAVRQKATVSLANPARQPVIEGVRNRFAQISAEGSAVLKPDLGLQLPREPRPLSAVETERLRALKIGHVRADLFLSHADWKTRLGEMEAQAKALGVRMHVALHLGPAADTELDELTRTLGNGELPVALWIVQKHGESYPTAATLDLARRKLGTLASNTPIAGAASPFFTEFNRNRPATSDTLVCYPYSPQVHLTDRTSVMENLLDVPEAIYTASTLSDQPVVVSPITLKRAEPKPSKRDMGENALPSTVDERQMSLFAAAWTVGHLAQLCGLPGLHSATYFETTGWRGVMETAEGSPLPAKFFSIPGTVFPVYHVFADLASFKQVRRMNCTRPLEAAALTLLDGESAERVLVANLLPHDQEVAVNLDAKQVRVSRLNATNAEEAMRAPEEFQRRRGETAELRNGVLALRLSAYEIVRIDS